MKKMILSLIFIFVTSHAYGAQKPEVSTDESLSPVKILMILPSMKLDLMTFETGLAENDETYWCSENINNGPTYAQSIRQNILKNHQSSLRETDVQLLEKAFSQLFELCEIADAQDFLKSDRSIYEQAVSTIDEVREILIEELH